MGETIAIRDALKHAILMGSDTGANIPVPPAKSAEEGKVEFEQIMRLKKVATVVSKFSPETKASNHNPNVLDITVSNCKKGLRKSPLKRERQEEEEEETSLDNVDAVFKA